MSQEPYKNDNKNRLPKFPNRPNPEGENPRKGPRFSIYWVYALIFAVLIGLQVFGSFSTSNNQIDRKKFTELLQNNEIEKYTIISNRNVVRVKLNATGIQAEEGKIGKNLRANDPYHATFKIASVESFKDDMRELSKTMPGLTNLEDSDTESNWFPSVLQTILPILIFIGLWVLLMRKMGGGGGAGGGPGGIFNIGKSRATLFDKGTRVNITFADVAGLDEAKVEVM